MDNGFLVIKKEIERILGHKVGDITIIKNSKDGEFVDLCINVSPRNPDKKFVISFRMKNIEDDK